MKLTCVWESQQSHLFYLIYEYIKMVNTPFKIAVERNMISPIEHNLKTTTNKKIKFKNKI